jgi:hypothetical protein
MDDKQIKADIAKLKPQYQAAVRASVNKVKAEIEARKKSAYED